MDKEIVKISRTFKPELLVFDCDGVLFDSKEANKKFYEYIIRKAGRKEPLTPEEVDFVHVHNVNECLEYLFRNEPEKLEIAKKIQEKTPFSLFFPYMKLEKGVKEFFKWAKPRFKIALCTNRSTSTVPLLKHFELLDFFDYLMTSLDTPKSNPLALKKILDHFKVPPEKTLYIGDSKVDENLCKTWKVPFVAYKNPELDCDFYVKSFYELKELLNKIS